jgi:hypothetical protein
VWLWQQSVKEGVTLRRRDSSAHKLFEGATNGLVSCVVCCCVVVCACVSGVPLFTQSNSFPDQRSNMPDNRHSRRCEGQTAAKNPPCTSIRVSRP